MKKLIKKTESRLDSVKAFGGKKCVDCSTCTCSCTSTATKRSTLTTKHRAVIFIVVYAV